MQQDSIISEKGLDFFVRILYNDRKFPAGIHTGRERIAEELWR